MRIVPRSQAKFPGARRRNWRLGLACLLLAGCSVSERKADLVIINGPDPATLDPALVTGIEDLRVISAVFEGLARNDPVTAAPIPGLAKVGKFRRTGGSIRSISGLICGGRQANRSRRTTWFIRG